MSFLSSSYHQQVNQFQTILTCCRTFIRLTVFSKAELNPLNTVDQVF